jgi:hypothetical protein
MNKKTQAVYKECGDILNERGPQYSKDEGFESFKTAARIANVEVDVVFRVMIGIKLARVLCGGNVHDSLVDAANYSMLWCGYLDE